MICIGTAACLRSVNPADSGCPCVQLALVSLWIIKHWSYCCLQEYIKLLIGWGFFFNYFNFFFLNNPSYWSILELSPCWREAWGGQLQALTALLVLAKSQVNMTQDILMSQLFSLCPPLFFFSPSMCADFGWYCLLAERGV